MSRDDNSERREKGAWVGVWKGLDPTVMPVFLGYEQTERMVAALLDHAVAWQPDLVIGITRGRLLPATMAATILAKPLAAISYERAAAVVSRACVVGAAASLAVSI